MKEWDVRLESEFAEEHRLFSAEVRIEMQARLNLLKQFGPTLGRPFVDTLYNSKHSNMKELRFDADGGVWRVAFAFDPARRAIMLVAGDKKGVNPRGFYKKLIQRADSRYDAHLMRLEKSNE